MVPLVANLQFLLGKNPWWLLGAKFYLRGPSSQFCLLGPVTLLVANFGIFTHKHPLVVNLGNNPWWLISVT